MRNPLKRLVRRDHVKVPLRERLAAAKAKATRVFRRVPAEADQGRRAMVAGSLAAALPLPALAAPAVVGPHPDQAVFDAEAAMLQAERAYDAAHAAFNAAHDALWQELGPCPPKLLLRDPDEDRSSFSWLGAPRHVRRDAPRFQFIDSVGEAWTADGLRKALRHAVAVYGRGGQTPHRCRRYRALLPIAEAFDARRAALEERFRTDALVKVSRDTSAAWTAAQAILNTTPAATPAGLAVIARHVSECGWERMSPNWRNLLRSAANVSGVELHEPDRPRIAAWHY